jgi:probable F420-dependent oxidoreductase
MRPFRVALQVGERHLDAIAQQAVAAEAAGFDVVAVGDHVGDEWEPLSLLAYLAERTSRIRLGTLVLNSDLYHPVLLARRVSALDHIAGGRMELGLGAGHTWHEYEALGRPFNPPAVRKHRLRETVEILRRLLDGDEVSLEGRFFRLRRARVMAALQPHLPILVAGSGHELLAHAARHADAIGLAGLGKTLSDGHRHEVRWSPTRLDAQVALLRKEAGERWGSLEINVLVQRVVITKDRVAAAEQITASVPSLTVEDALATPFLALGTPDEIAAQFIAARDRWGVTYLSVRSLEFAPVVERLRAVGV